MAHTYPVSPLLTLRFHAGRDGPTVLRHWYHAPRVGEAVEIAGLDERMRVAGVLWLDSDGSGPDAEVFLLPLWADSEG